MVYSPYDKEKYPTRKNPRMTGYDYSTQNHYFVTVCTHEKKCIFGPPGNLNEFGKIVENSVMDIPEHYPGVRLEKYVVMPNHVHMILFLQSGAARLDHIVGSVKSHVTSKIHKQQPNLTVWQKSFHDHVIRNVTSYQNIWMYIENNPLNWEKDCFYKES